MNPVAPFNFGTAVVTSVHINSLFLWAVLALFFVLYLIISVVLIYHWRAYGMNNKAILLAESVFIIVSLVLFGLSILSIGLF